MEDYLKGWKELSEVKIPPVEKKGFAQNVIIRERIAPKEVVKEVVKEPVVESQAYTGDDPTTILERPIMWHAYIRRMNTSEEVEITKSPFLMGKSAECDYVVKDNSTVSRCHAQIITTAEGYMLEDLNSSNHTFIERIQINDSEKLTDGTSFQLSDEEFQFMVEMK